MEPTYAEVRAAEARAEEAERVARERERAVWLKERRTGIGASEAAAIFGLSPYKTPLQLYHEKLGTIEESAGEREATRWGKLLEGPIIGAYAEETKRAVTRPGEFALARHPTVPFMVATLDARVEEWSPVEGVLVGDVVDPLLAGPGVLEVKNATFFKREDWKREPPLAFQIQLQHQLAVTGHTWGSIAGLIGGIQFVWTDLPRNEQFISMLVDREAEFWQRIQRHEEPLADGSEATRELLKKLYPRDSGATIELPLDFIDIDGEYRRLDEEMDRLKERREECRNRMRQALGDATAGVLRNGVMWTLKTVNRRGYQVGPTSYRDLRRHEAKPRTA